MKEKKGNWTKWLYVFSLAVAIILVYKTVDNLGEIWKWVGKLFSILMPFVIGILIAYLLYIPAGKIENKYLKSKNKLIKSKARGLSIFTTYVIAILVIAIAINFIVPALIESITDLLNNFQNYYNTTINALNNLPEDSILKKEIVFRIAEYIKAIDIEQYINIGKLTEYAKGAISIVNSLFDIFVALIVSVYILMERKEILSFFRRIARTTFNEETFNSIEKYFNKTNGIFFNFISSQVIDGIIVGIITSIAMRIMGVKYAVLLGFMIGLFNLIPYFGAIIAVIIATIITIFTGGIGQAIWMVVVVTILQQIDANIINPKIVSNSLKISPILVIFSVTIGGAFFGVLGMFLAVPAMAVIKLIILDYIDIKEQKRKYNEET